VHAPTSTRSEILVTGLSPIETDVTEVAATLDLMSLNPTSTSPGHTARLVAATGVPLNKRVLTYHEAPPAPSDTTLTQQREIARPLYVRSGALPSSTGTVTNRSRKIATQAGACARRAGNGRRLLPQPALVVRAERRRGRALREHVHLEGRHGAVVQVGEAPEGTYVSSVDFSNDGAFLGSGRLGRGRALGRRERAEAALGGRASGAGRSAQLARSYTELSVAATGVSGIMTCASHAQGDGAPRTQR
jgi:hypothetical protein